MAVRRAASVDRGPGGPDPNVVAPRLAALLLDSFIVAVLQALLGHYFPAFHLRVQNPHALDGSLTLGFNRQDLDLVSRVGLTASLYFVYFILFETAIAATPGKLIAGLRVVDRAGRRASWPAALIRNLFRPIDAAGAYVLGGIVMLASSRRQRIGDHAAGTLVVSAQSVAGINPPSTNGSLLLRSVAVLVLLTVVACAVSYFVPPPLTVATSEAFYPVNGAVINGGPPGARSLSSVHVTRERSVPGSVTYHLRFELTTRERHVREQCDGLVTFLWAGALDGWMYQKYSEACSNHRTG